MYDRTEISEENSIVILSEEAKEIYRDWFAKNEDELHDHELPISIKNILGKFRSYVYRLALNLHKMEEAGKALLEGKECISINKIISGETMERAVKLIEFFKLHTYKAFDYQKRDEISFKAEYILKYMKKHGLKECTKEVLMKNCRPQREYIPVKKIISCIELLEIKNYGTFNNDTKTFELFE